MASIDLLPEEILLEIFKHLDLKDLGRCAQVCIKFRNVSLDEKVWPKKLNLNGKLVPSQFLGQAISRGLIYLSFCCGKLSGNVDLPKENNVKYLNLYGHCHYSDGFIVNPEDLTKLMSSFCSLEKLSLGEIIPLFQCNTANIEMVFVFIELFMEFSGGLNPIFLG